MQSVKQLPNILPTILISHRPHIFSVCSGVLGIAIHHCDNYCIMYMEKMCIAHYIHSIKKGIVKEETARKERKKQYQNYVHEKAVQRQPTSRKGLEKNACTQRKADIGH